MFRQVRTLIDEWLDGLNKDGQTLDHIDIQARLSGGEPLDTYKLSAVCVIQAIFNPTLRRIQVVCLPESSGSYLTRPASHITAEQITRCLSETCYLLGIVLNQSGELLFEGNIEEDNFFYAGDEGRFRRPEPANRPLTFTLTLDKTARLGQSVAYYFGITKGSKRGTALCFYAPDGSQQVLNPNLYSWLYEVWQSAWAELPKFKLNAMRLIARLLHREWTPGQYLVHDRILKLDQPQLQPVPITA